MKSYEEYEEYDEYDEYDEYEEEHKLIGENRENKKCNLCFILTSSLLFFCLSISDLSYSYIDIDPCQLKSEPIVLLTLNVWLRVNGIYGLLYYVLTMVIYLHVSPYLPDTTEYTRNLYFSYNFMLIFFTIIGLLWTSVGMYTFIHYFWETCDSYTILVYMWIRVIIGIGSYLAMFFIIPVHILNILS